MCSAFSMTCRRIGSLPVGRDRDQALTWIAFARRFGHPSTGFEASVDRIPAVVFAWSPFEHAQPPERPKGHHVRATTTAVATIAAMNAFSAVSSTLVQCIKNLSSSVGLWLGQELDVLMVRTDRDVLVRSKAKLDGKEALERSASRPFRWTYRNQRFPAWSPSRISPVGSCTWASRNQSCLSTPRETSVKRSAVPASPASSVSSMFWRTALA